MCRQFVLGDVRATIPVENLSAAMALVSLDSPLRVTSGKSRSEHVFSASPPEGDTGPMDHLSVVGRAGRPLHLAAYFILPVGTREDCTILVL